MSGDDASGSGLLHALEIDDSFRTERVLGTGETGRTELVSLPHGSPMVRKRIAWPLANPEALGVLLGIDQPRLPRMVCLYAMPNELVAVYEYVEGETLADLVQREGPLAPGRSVGLLAQVGEAVAALHARGVVHRDVTPSNVIVAQDGAHLIDLGIARVHSDGMLRDTTTLGTVGYAAPEQFGFAQTDARSDVYSMGRLLQFMLTGSHPRDAGSLVGLSDAGVPASLRQVVAIACALEPSARYQDVGELVAAARDALVRGPVESAVVSMRPGASAAEQPEPSTPFDRVGPDASEPRAASAPAESIAAPARPSSLAHEADAVEPVAPLSLTTPRHRHPAGRGEGRSPLRRWLTLWQSYPAEVRSLMALPNHPGKVVSLVSLLACVALAVAFACSSVAQSLAMPAPLAAPTLVVLLGICADVVAIPLECMGCALGIGRYEGCPHRTRGLVVATLAHLAALCLLTLAAALAYAIAIAVA